MGRPPNPAKQEMIKCLICGVVFTSYRSKQSKFCSNPCAIKQLTIAKWRGGELTTNCKLCGGTLTSYACHKRSYCSRSCAAKMTKNRTGHPGQRGADNPGWIKDRSKLKTSRIQAYDVRYKYWMFEVKKRDNWRCQVANDNCKGRLEAHHILSWRDYPELRYQVNNGITLCHFHHPRVRKEEKRLSPYFQDLVSV